MKIHPRITHRNFLEVWWCHLNDVAEAVKDESDRLPHGDNAIGSNNDTKELVHVMLQSYRFIATVKR